MEMYDGSGSWPYVFIQHQNQAVNLWFAGRLPSGY